MNKYDTEVLLTLDATPDATTLLNLLARLDAAEQAARDATNRADVLQRDLNAASEAAAALRDANAKLVALAHRLDDDLLAAGLKYEGLRSALGVLSKG